LGTFKPILLAVLMLVTAKARLPQKNGVNGYLPTDYYFASVNVIRVSLKKGCH
jgi:hypothetical protein